WRVRHRGLHRLRSTTTFALRKAELFRRSDGAVIFPGGFGTLDEFGDLLALKQNGYLGMPLVLLNTAGYYDDLLRWVRRARREGFLYGGKLFEIAASPGAALRRLATAL
ncbi:MAG TPA: LOG family protein, partial [Planctomycetota bacterium]|nr:LOG family protein [Planctomycetota bacterium]